MLSVPGEVLEAAGIDPTSVVVLDQQIPNWRVVVNGQPAVLKRDWHLDVSDIAWEHAFLSKLATTGFPAPRPIDAFDGHSWIVLAGALWTVVTFQPGHTLGWRPRPGLAEVGRFIARYHAAVEGIEMDRPRPLVPSIDELAAVAPWDRLEATLHGSRGIGRFRTHLDQVVEELATTDHASAPRLMIHGDFTTNNILVDGEPPSIVGAIDFALTQWEPPIADLAFGLWRSGRADPAAMALDPQRVATVLAGYLTRRALSAGTVGMLPTYLKARGLQLIVRATRAGAKDCSVQLERLGAIAAQHDELLAALHGLS